MTKPAIIFDANPKVTNGNHVDLEQTMQKLKNNGTDVCITCESAPLMSNSKKHGITFVDNFIPPSLGSKDSHDYIKDVAAYMKINASDMIVVTGDEEMKYFAEKQGAHVIFLLCTQEEEPAEAVQAKYNELTMR